MVSTVCLRQALDKYAVCLYVFFSVSESCGQTCPSYKVGFVGNGNQRLGVPSSLYINSVDTSPCAGTVYGWRYCSYPTSGAAPFHVQLSMYREIPDNHYQLVSGSSYQLTVEENIDSYTCQDRFLDPAEYFSVEQGDMVAACWNSSASKVELFVRNTTRRRVLYGHCVQELIDENRLGTPRVTLLLSAYISKCTTLYNCFHSI